MRRALALFQVDLQAHPVRKRWREDPAEDRSRRQSVPLDAELRQPARVLLEAFDPFEVSPELLWREGEHEFAVVVDDARISGLLEAHHVSACPMVQLRRGKSDVALVFTRWCPSMRGSGCSEI